MRTWSDVYYFDDAFTEDDYDVSRRWFSTIAYIILRFRVVLLLLYHRAILLFFVA